MMEQTIKVNTVKKTIFTCRTPFCNSQLATPGKTSVRWAEIWTGPAWSSFINKLLKNNSTDFRRLFLKIMFSVLGNNALDHLLLHYLIFPIILEKGSKSLF